ncbi:MAG: helix-turn-helix domain-containing protein [Bacteroidales bacterium]|nr:helix-turn-helix domain-containing protein [Bacteroidales bacterium]
MNERIKQVRKACGLKQAEFADRIGVKPSTVTSYETGLRVPSDTVIFSICREFRVSETWLRTGEGEMFLPMDADEELAQVLAEIKLSDDKLIKAIIKSYWRLDDAGKAVIRQMVDDLAQAVQDDGPEQKEKAPGD